MPGTLISLPSSSAVPVTGLLTQRRRSDLPFLLPPPLSQAVMPTQAVATKAESRIEVSFGVDIGRPTLAKPSRRENLRPPIGARAVRDIREIARTRPNSSSRASFSIARRHRLPAA